MVGPLTISLGLGLATLTGGQMHHDSDFRCIPKSQDPALTMKVYRVLWLQGLNTQIHESIRH